MLVSSIELGFLFFFSLASLFFLRKVAKKVGLVDKPNERKQHNGAIPLVGGIAITICLLYFLFNHPYVLSHPGLYSACIIVLVIVGALDDKYDISFKLRFAVQASLSVAMMMLANIELHTIGNIFGFGPVELGPFGYVVTVLAVIGAINAFNMVDGIDGLLGGLSIVTFGGLGIMVWQDGQRPLAYMCLVMVVVLIPYILLNLGAFGRKRKVFMGDAGSMVIGFSVIWFLLQASQNGTSSPLQPVTALWLIAVPLMDMAAIMLRRMRRGVSPFKPDREHLHHIFQRLGLNSTQTLAVICTIASLFAAFGMLSEYLNVPESVRFCFFCTVFIVYYALLSNVWKVTSVIRRWRVKQLRRARQK